MIRRLIPAIALLVLCLFAAPRSVAAYDFFQGGDCGTNATAIACQSQPHSDSSGHLINPLNDTLARITNIVAYVAGAAAVIVIIVSALRLVTSGSNVSTGSRTDTDVEDARRSLAGAAIGLAVIVLARILILYLVHTL